MNNLHVLIAEKQMYKKQILLKLIMNQKIIRKG